MQIVQKITPTIEVRIVGLSTDIGCEMIITPIKNELKIDVISMNIG